MDAACTIQDSIHVFSLVRKYVSRILGTYHLRRVFSHTRCLTSATRFAVSYISFDPLPGLSETVIKTLSLI